MTALSVFYGAPESGDLDVLAGYHTVIVQTGLYSWMQLARLRRSARVFGYLSVGEDHPLGEWACVPGSAPYHLELNPAWGSVRVDAAHPGWQATVLTRAAQALAHADGLLLDTLESADPAATVALIRVLRAAWPHAALYANRGFTVLPELSGLIDGVLIESFSTTHTPSYAPHTPDGLAYTAHWLRQVQGLGLDALALDYAETPEVARVALDRAERENIPTFVTNRSLNLPGGYRAHRSPAPAEPAARRLLLPG